MYETKKRVSEAKLRAAHMIEKKEKRAIRCLSALCVIFSCLLVGAIAELSGGTGKEALVQGMNGATLLSESTGGYVFVAVVSFIAAVCLTLLCIKIREKNIHIEHGKKED